MGLLALSLSNSVHFLLRTFGFVSWNAVAQKPIIIGPQRLSNTVFLQSLNLNHAQNSNESDEETPRGL
jgi:hypothetical protein